MNWYIKVIKQYTDFQGRASRTEYWMFTLFNIIFVFAFALFDIMFGLNFENSPYGVFYILYSLFVFLPSLAVATRRLHDIGKSGWYVLITLIPIIGTIYFIVLMCTEGEKIKNRYGENPKKGNLNSDDSLLLDEGLELIKSDETTNSQQEVKEYIKVSPEAIILLIAIWMAFNQMKYFIEDIFNDNGLSFSSYRVSFFRMINNFIGGLVPISLAFVSKKKSIRITILIIGIIYFLLSRYYFYKDTIRYL